MRSLSIACAHQHRLALRQVGARATAVRFSGVGAGLLDVGRPTGKRKKISSCWLAQRLTVGGGVLTAEVGVLLVSKKQPSSSRTNTVVEPLSVVQRSYFKLSTRLA